MLLELKLHHPGHRHYAIHIVPAKPWQSGAAVFIQGVLSGSDVRPRRKVIEKYTRHDELQK
jgi:hypothetical protein